MAVGRASERRSARRRSLVALLLAVAAHGFLAVLLFDFIKAPEPLPPPPATPDSKTRIIVDLVAPKPAPKPVVPPKQPHRLRHKAELTQGLAKPATDAEEKPGITLGPPPPIPMPPSPPAPVGPERTLSLGDLLTLPPLPAAQGSGSPVPVPRDARAEEQALVQGRIDADVSEHKAEDRVGVGLVDPYFTQLGNSFRGKWKPKVSDAGGSADNGALGQLANLIKSWNSVGKQYAATGSPFPDSTAPLPAETKPFQRDPAGNSGYDAVDFLTRWNAGEFAFSGGLVLVELTQKPDGQPIAVKIVKSSGSKDLDESAKRSVLEAARLGDAPPKHGLGLGGPDIRSLWEMQARMVSNTCVPATDPTGDTGGNKGSGALPGLMCGGTFDLALGTAEVNAPGQTRVVTHVVLIAVYGGENAPYEAKPGAGAVTQ